jgi:hypothetical protein
VTLLENAPVASVFAIARSAGAEDDDSIVIWTGEEGAKPTAETVI